MKKLIIFFIVLVLITTFAIMRYSIRTPKGPILTEQNEQEIEEYRRRVEKVFKEKNENINDEKVKQKMDDMVKEYSDDIRAQNNKPKKSKTFGEAFSESIKICGIVCGIIALIYIGKNAQYNEFYGSHFGRDINDKTYDNDKFRGIRRFFSGWIK